MTGHRVTSPMLLGVKTEGQLGGRDELMQAFEIYQNTVVKPYQEHILKTIEKILLVNDIKADLQIVQSSPIMTTFTVEDMRNVMTKEEIREKLGLEPLEQENLESEKLAKVGDIDGMPVYSTVEEALIKAKELGCEGFHEHELNGEKVYMPCAKHEDTKTRMSEEKSELDKCLEEYGEDISDEWEVINEEEAQDELEDFDFENDLNTNHIKLTSTGSAYTNRKSGQDQTTKQEKYQDHIYRVRYRYAGAKTGEREFCNKMIKANKVYRKEDILAMGRRAVNPGWGKGGANTYSIWKYKGGGNCRHKWFRVILVQKGSRPKNSDEVISSTEARSRGVKLPRNAQEVSVAPRDLPNNGFVKKR